jgi:uncharacterized repeat protein (TIGR03843 family)
MISQLVRLAAFDCIINNADRKGGHCVVDSQGHLWGIDHGIAFHPAPKLRTVIWDFAGQPITESLLTDMEALCGKVADPHSTIRQQFSELLSEEEIAALQARVRRLLKSRRFPQPGQPQLPGRRCNRS